MNKDEYPRLCTICDRGAEPLNPIVENSNPPICLNCWQGCAIFDYDPATVNRAFKYLQTVKAQEDAIKELRYIYDYFRHS